jgi:hypothetical protein
MVTTKIREEKRENHRETGSTGRGEERGRWGGESLSLFLEIRAGRISTQRRKVSKSQKYKDFSGLRLCVFASLRYNLSPNIPAQTSDGQHSYRIPQARPRFEREREIHRETRRGGDEKAENLDLSPSSLLFSLLLALPVSL